MSATVILVCSNYSFAQSQSKILFFRNDNRFVFKPFSLKYDLFHNGKKISRTVKHSVLVYESSDVNGTYLIKAKKNNFECSMPLNVSSNSTTFVEFKIKLGQKEPLLSLKEISFSEFKTLYDTKKWLRRKVLKAGFSSLSQIVNKP